MKKLLVIGCGKMGTAILKSTLGQDLFDEVFILDPFFSSEQNIKSKKLELEAKDLCDVKIFFHYENSKILELSEDYFDLILISIKPQGCEKYLTEYSKFKTAIFYSIMAAKTINQIGACLAKNAKIARCMPNLCAGVQKSSSLVCFSKNIKTQDEQFIEQFTKSFGYFHKIKENLFDEMTIISGCVPAFFALFCDSLLLSMSSKVNKEIATSILKESLFGTGEVLLAKNSTFQNFIQSVCSKGGVTEAGVEVFKDKFNKASKKARNAILKRSESLSKLS